MKHVYILLNHVKFDIDTFLTHVNEHFGTLLAIGSLEVPPLDSDNQTKHSYVHSFSTWCNANFDKDDNSIRLKVEGNTVTIASYFLHKKSNTDVIVQQLIKILQAHPSYPTHPPLWINWLGQTSKHPFGPYRSNFDMVTVYNSCGILFKPEVVSDMMALSFNVMPSYVSKTLNLSIEYTMGSLKGEQKTKYAVVRLGNLICLLYRKGNHVRVERVLMIGANRLSEENKYFLNYVFGPCIEGDGPGQLISVTESFEFYPRHLELATYLINRPA